VLVGDRRRRRRVLVPALPGPSSRVADGSGRDRRVLVGGSDVRPVDRV